MNHLGQRLGIMVGEVLQQAHGISTGHAQQARQGGRIAQLQQRLNRQTPRHAADRRTRRARWQVLQDL